MSFQLLELIGIILSIVSNFALGLLILARNPKNPINKLFSLFCLFITVWGSCLLFYEYPIFFTSFFWIKATYFVVTIAISILSMFSFIFPKNLYSKTRIYAVIGNIIFISVTAYLLYFTNLWIEKVDITFQKGLQTHLGQGYLIWSLMIWIMFGWALLNFISTSKKSSPVHKTQLLYLFYGLGLWGIFTTIADIVIPLIFKDTRFFSLSAVSSLSFTFAVGYTILRHRFFDIRLIVARSVVFSLSMAIMGVLYTAMLFIGSTYILKTSTDSSNMIASTILALIVAFSFHPLKRFLEKITNNIFYKDRYNSQTLLRDLSLIMASTAYLSELQSAILQKLINEIKIDFGIIILTRDNLVISVKEAGKNTNSEFDETKINYLIGASVKNKENLLVFEEIEEDPEEKRIMREYNISMALSLIVKDEAIGIMLLGAKSSGEIYSVEDINVLKILAPEIAIAVKNALSYEEIKRFNITLKEEVDIATKDLQDANEKLKQVDKLKDDFLSIASHELRTPMTAIKSYVWLLLNDKKEILSEKQKTHLERTYESVERLIKLVNDMLNVSRIESGRIIMDTKLIDIEKLSQDIIAEMQPKASENNIELSLEKDGQDFPYAVADTDKTREVFINLIGNSLKFTPKNGKITVYLGQKDNMIIVSVADSGLGLKPDDIPKLFQKFGIGGNGFLTKQNTQGTGLGLYISKSIIELQGGKMWAQSLGENKGSTFYFTLKTYKSGIIAA